jgi:hypothetical protein
MKIIDFFAAREALQSAARSADKEAELRRHIRAIARQKKHVCDPFEDLMFLVLLMAAAVLGLLAISGFG